MNAEPQATTMVVYEYPASPLPAGPQIWGDLIELNSDSLIETQPRQSAPIAPAGMEEEAARVKADQERVVDRQRSLETGRLKGVEEGRQIERAAQAGTRLVEEKRRAEQTAELLERFAAERDKYLHDVEQEVVELALAIAARILRREAQMDPLLLTGAVRVALGQLSDTTRVTLRVPGSELDLWKKRSRSSRI